MSSSFEKRSVEAMKSFGDTLELRVLPSLKAFANFRGGCALTLVVLGVFLFFLAVIFRWAWVGYCLPAGFLAIAALIIGRPKRKAIKAGVVRAAAVANGISTVLHRIDLLDHKVDALLRFQMPIEAKNCSIVISLDESLRPVNSEMFWSVFDLSVTPKVRVKNAEGESVINLPVAATARMYIVWKVDEGVDKKSPIFGAEPLGEFPEFGVAFATISEIKK